MAANWEEYVARQFPGYLLPASAARSLSAGDAAKFLEQLSGRPDQLTLLRTVSVMAKRAADLRPFALVELPSLIRVLPSHTTVTPREWNGGFQGRLDLPRTLSLHRAGHRTRFVTSARRRTFNRPENVLVHHVARRLLGLAVDLRQAGFGGASSNREGWTGALEDCEGSLRRALFGTALREINDEPLQPHHVQAARAQAHPCYALACRWHQALTEGLDSDNPETIARVVAEGALAPLSAATRFELAVLIRLIEALAETASNQPLRRGLIDAGRGAVAELHLGGESAIRVFYNQAVLPPGLVEEAAVYYLGSGGRMRPDITIQIIHPGGDSFILVEVKCTDDPSYRQTGFHEAVIYAREHAPRLTTWPKSILVTSSRVDARPRWDHDVVAVGWDDWVPRSIIESIRATATGSLAALS